MLLEEESKQLRFNTIKEYHDYLKKNDLRGDVKIISTKEMTYNQPVFKRDPDTKIRKLSKERGADLINKAVMQKGDSNMNSLNVNIDSEKLEYAWQYLAKNLEKALRDKKITKNNILVADNIREQDDSVIFDFIFLNKDSKQYTNGKEKKIIHAGKIESTIVPGKIQEVERINKLALWVVSTKEALLRIKIDNEGQWEQKVALLFCVSADGKRNVAQNTKNMIEMSNIIDKNSEILDIGKEITVNIKAAGMWLEINNTENPSAEIEQFFTAYPSYRFDVENLYKKYGIDPATKKANGKQNLKMKGGNANRLS